MLIFIAGVVCVIVKTIQSGSLVLAKRSNGVDTCIILQHYSGLVSSEVMYYYSWSIREQAFVIIYDVDILGVIDDDFGMELEITYPEVESNTGYAANGFRWRAVTGIDPNNVESNGFLDIIGPFDEDSLEED